MLLTQRKFTLWTVLLVAVVLLNIAGDAKAEAVVNGSATATILAALTVTADSAIRFGNILQGVPVTVSNAANDSSAVFRISGQILGKQIYLFLYKLRHNLVGQEQTFFSQPHVIF